MEDEMIALLASKNNISVVHKDGAFHVYNATFGNLILITVSQKDVLDLLLDIDSIPF